MSEQVLLLWLVLAVVSFMDVRFGLGLTVVAGFGQDLLRKLTPGQPAVLQVTVWVVMGATVLGAILSTAGGMASLGRVFSPAVRRALGAFLAIVVLQSVVGLARLGTPLVVVLGAISYLAPVPALLAVVTYARSESRIRSLLGLYVLLGTANGIAVILSALGAESRFLDAVGEEMFVYEAEGVLRLVPGLMRAGEVSAWHCATAAAICLSVALWSLESRGRIALNWVSPIPVLVAATILTGRRKALVVLLAQAAAVAWLFTATRLARYRTTRRAVTLLLGLVAIVALVVSREGDSSVSSYLLRASSSKDELGDRLGVVANTTLGALRGGDFVGLGVGAATQGARYANERGVEGEGIPYVEGVPSKVAAELGLAGVAASAVLGWGLVAQLRNDLRNVPFGAGKLFAISASLYLAANGISAATSHQVFGDPFVLTAIGLLFGVVVAVSQGRTLPNGVVLGPTARDAVLNGDGTRG